MCAHPTNELLHRQAVLANHPEHAHVGRALVVLLPELQDDVLAPRVGRGWIPEERVVAVALLLLEDVPGEGQEAPFLIT